MVKTTVDLLVFDVTISDSDLTCKITQQLNAKIYILVTFETTLVVEGFMFQRSSLNKDTRQHLL